jgi:hypothetical protein
MVTPDAVLPVAVPPVWAFEEDDDQVAQSIVAAWAPPPANAASTKAAAGKLKSFTKTSSNNLIIN